MLFLFYCGFDGGGYFVVVGFCCCFLLVCVLLLFLFGLVGFFLLTTRTLGVGVVFRVWVFFLFLYLYALSMNCIQSDVDVEYSEYFFSKSSGYYICTTKNSEKN